MCLNHDVLTAKVTCQSVESRLQCSRRGIQDRTASAALPTHISMRYSNCKGGSEICFSTISSKRFKKPKYCKGSPSNTGKFLFGIVIPSRIAEPKFCMVFRAARLASFSFDLTLEVACGRAGSTETPLPLFRRAVLGKNENSSNPVWYGVVADDGNLQVQTPSHAPSLT